MDNIVDNGYTITATIKEGGKAVATRQMKVVDRDDALKALKALTRPDALVNDSDEVRVTMTAIAKDFHEVWGEAVNIEILHLTVAQLKQQTFIKEMK